MKRKVGYGIIGAGMIARFHAEALRQLERAELVAVFDSRPEAARKIAEEFPCRVYTDLDAFLAAPDVQAVTIATPSGTHGELAIAAARAGKHILCEKPLEITVEKVDAILRACAENKVLLAPVFQTRFDPEVQLIKSAVDAGRLGKIVLASLQMHWFREPSYYAGSAWRGTWAMDGGGALMNQAIHLVDILLYLNGDADEIYAAAGALTHKIEVEDTLCATVKFCNGSLGTVEVSTSCRPGYPRKLELLGSKGAITMEASRITRWDFPEEMPGDAEIRRGISAVDAAGGSSPANIDVSGHVRQLGNLTDAILDGTELLLDGREGRRAVKFICGAYDSVRTGRPHQF